MHAVIVIAILALLLLPLPFHSIPFSSSFSISRSLVPYQLLFPHGSVCRVCIVSMLQFSFEYTHIVLFHLNTHTLYVCRSLCVFVCEYIFVAFCFCFCLCCRCSCPTRMYLYFGFCFFYSSVALFRYITNQKEHRREIARWMYVLKIKCRKRRWKKNSSYYSKHSSGNNNNNSSRVQSVLALDVYHSVK